MKILMVITLGDLGGAQRHVLDTSAELAARGYEVTVAIGGTQMALESALYEANSTIAVVRIPHLIRDISFVSEIRALVELYRLVRKLKPDVVHCHSSKAGVIASIAGKIAGAHVVYTAHGFVFRENISLKKQWFYRCVEWFASIFRDRVIAVSDSDREAAIKAWIVQPKKIITIHNGIALQSTDAFLSRSNARAEMSRWAGANLSDAHLAVAIANLYPPKNIPLLIRSFEFVVRRDPKARLLIIGDGEERAKCEALIQAVPILAKTVFMAGQRAGAVSHIKGADVICLSSTKEGLPYVLLEAKLAGVPIVATRVGGVAEIGEGPGMQLVVSHSPELLAEKISEILLNPPHLMPGLPEEFTLNHMVNSIESLYLSIV